MNNPEIEKSKTRARSILTRLKDLGANLGLQQAFEVLAAADGHRNWATMKAGLERLKPVAEVDDIPKSWWNSVAEPSPMVPRTSVRR
jgi:hypothetical protein